MPFDFKINDSFWGRYQKLICESVIPFQRKVLDDAVEGVEKSHALENFRIAAGMSKGEYYGWVFQDSDAAKWIEAASYSLMLNYDMALDEDLDEIIDILGKAQQPDGYLDTYFILKAPGKQWTNLQEAHELYCAGHMIEAAVAHYRATGKTSLLDIMKKCADNICDTFGAGKRRGFPGHPELELALVKLSEATGDEKYLKEAEYFVNERGTKPNFFLEEKSKRDWTVWNMDAGNSGYMQNDQPVREQDKAEGHAVRAVYLYSGMADVAMGTGDDSLKKACERLWDNITEKQMYITGGIGQSHKLESFSADYDLPNDTAYAESCASVGLVFFAKRMLKLCGDAKYADVMERALYNCVLAGMSLDGKSFFYVNPLEAEPDYDGKLDDYEHVLAERPHWHSCACCPPNIARMLASLGDYVMHVKDETLYADLFVGGSAEFPEFPGLRVETETDYPNYGNVSYRFKIPGTKLSFALRVPDWCSSYSISLNGKSITPEFSAGYARIEVGDGDLLEYKMEMKPRKVYSNPLVRENDGACCIQRGPIVYCFEEKDNPCLRYMRINAEGELTELPYDKDTLGGIVPVEVEGVILKKTESLYSYDRPKAEKPVQMRAVPYRVWANRGANRMAVWINEN